MADDTRVTHPRALALALSLLGLLSIALPTAARAQTLDPYRSEQWALQNDGPDHLSPMFGKAVAGADARVTAAWDDGWDGTGVTVAVVDTAIEQSQPDLAGQLEPEYVVPGYVECDSTTIPDHGTQVAGVVAALRDNGTDISGVAPAAKILPVRALDNCGGGSRDWVVQGLDYAATNAPIVVGSFASDPLASADDKAANQAAFDAVFAAHPNTLFVVAAGQEGNDNDLNKVFPCSSTEPNVLCVGYSDYADQPSCTSNVGVNSVDLFAPGQGIYSTVPGGRLPQTFSGTSAAAPMVAGVAALVLQSHGVTVPTDGVYPLADLVADLDNVDPKSAMSPISLSGGRLDAARAVGDAHPTPGPNPAMTWASCDGDHDGVRDSSDNCPAVPGPVGAPYRGCPDTDGDGRLDNADDCPGVANPTQADTDGDGVGDACDTLPRGPDADGDGLAYLDDSCPSVYAVTANGCPAPVVTPTATPTVTPSPPPPPPVALRVSSLSVKLLGHRCKAHRTCRRTARVTVKLSRTANVALVVEKRVRSHGHWKWRRVTKHTLYGTTTGSHLTVRRLSRASYRVSTALLGASTVRRSFRV
jgi:hypothetical protein